MTLVTFVHKNNQRMRRTRGFTLIELLVVISIIGLLSSIVLASLNTARAKARDAALFEGTHQLMLALELYYNQNGQFPPSAHDASGSQVSLPCSQAPYCAYTNIQGSATNSTFSNDLQPYMSSLPDPGTFSNPDKSNTKTSRLMYEVLANSGADIPAGCTATAQNCFVLAVYPETSSALGPAGQPVYFLSDGEIRSETVDRNLW